MQNEERYNSDSEIKRLAILYIFDLTFRNNMVKMHIPRYLILLVAWTLKGVVMKKYADEIL